jgi:hypothetical protein
LKDKGESIKDKTVSVFVNRARVGEKDVSVFVNRVRSSTQETMIPFGKKRAAAKPHWRI